MELPIEIVNLILEFAGKIKWRNGKYMDQISFETDTYKLISENVKNKIKIPSSNIFHESIWLIPSNTGVRHTCHYESSAEDFECKRFEIIRHYNIFNRYRITFRKIMPYTFLYKIRQIISWIFYLRDPSDQPYFVDYDYEYE
jgi:hypothetical protein